MLELLALVIGSTILVGYSVYVGTEMVRTDYYSRGQKIAQTIVLVLFPLIGALIVHWFLRLHQAAADAPDRRFIPQQEENADLVRRDGLSTMKPNPALHTDARKRAEHLRAQVSA